MSLGTVEATGLGELVDAGLLATAAAFSVKLELCQVLYKALWASERPVSVRSKSAF